MLRHPLDVVHSREREDVLCAVRHAICLRGHWRCVGSWTLLGVSGECREVLSKDQSDSGKATGVQWTTEEQEGSGLKINRSLECGRFVDGQPHP